MKKTFILFVFMTSISFFASAQFSAELQNAFQEILNDLYEESGVVGLSVAVLSEDDIWASSVGMHGADSILTTSSTFAMGSVSKTITSATILQMMEDELLSLDDPLSLYLDAMTNVPPEVTIRQLLNHTSGIHDYSTHPDYVDYLFLNASEWVTEEFILDNFLNPPVATPGSEFYYSNTNYILLGFIIEAISGEPYYTEVRNRFDFDNNYPSLTLPPFESDIADMAHVFYDTSATGNQPVIDMVEQGIILNSFFSSGRPDGAWASNPTDLAQWAYDLYSGDILEPATMDSLITIHAPSEYYGQGVVVFDEPDCGGGFLGHGGSFFYTAATYYQIENGISVSVHCNEIGADITGEVAFSLICAYETLTQVSNTEEIALNEEIEIFPNPFTDQISVKYEMENAGEVQVELLNELGRRVDQWSLGKKSSGVHATELNTQVPSGIYFLKIRMDEQLAVKRLVKI